MQEIGVMRRKNIKKNFMQFVLGGGVELSPVI